MTPADFVGVFVAVFSLIVPILAIGIIIIFVLVAIFAALMLLALG